jgi:hypothetical protein
MEQDVILMVNNAKTYNEPGSDVHEDAVDILVFRIVSFELSYRVI